MNYKYIKTESIKNKVFQIKLNNPKSRNAINSVMLDEIIHCLTHISKIKNIRILVITGEGESFSAGADLEWMKQ